MHYSSVSNIVLIKIWWIISITTAAFIAVSVSETPPAQVQEDLTTILELLPFKEHPPTEVREDQVKFYLYQRFQTDPILLTDENLHLIDQTRPLKYIIHGWRDNYLRTWIRTMTAAYLRKGNYKVIAVDWQELAAPISYPESAQNTRGVGKVLAKHLLKTGVPLENVHLIGHSLGAHVSGFASDEIKKILNTSEQNITRITGLDPAGPLFQRSPADQRLDATDAVFVDVTHTDAGLFGYAGPTGTVDFFPNGGSGKQPGCPDISNDMDILYDVAVSTVFCSHFKSVHYFTESINSGRFKAKKCSSYLNYLTSCAYFGVRVVYGEDVSTSLYGSYYFKTNPKSPYAQG